MTAAHPDETSPGTAQHLSDTTLSGAEHHAALPHAPVVTKDLAS